MEASGGREVPPRPPRRGAKPSPLARPAEQGGEATGSTHSAAETRAHRTLSLGLDMDFMEEQEVEEERLFKLLVLVEQEGNCGFVARKFVTKASTKEQLRSNIRKAFSIEQAVHLSYFDCEYQSYVVLDSLADLPAKGKVRVSRVRRPFFEEDFEVTLDRAPEIPINALDRALTSSGEMGYASYAPIDCSRVPPVCSSAELFEMVWTVLNVFVSNMEEAEVQAAQQGVVATALPQRVTSTGRSNTLPSAFASPRSQAPERRVHEFVRLVDTMASLYPDQPTSIVLRSVLQDYDVKRAVERMQEANEAKAWLRLVFERVKEALFNTYDGQFNQHTLNTQARRDSFSRIHSPVLRPGNTSRVSSPHESITEYATGALELPDELLLHIFSLLGPAELVELQQVCRRWAALASDGRLWKKAFRRYWVLKYTHIYGTWEKLIMDSGGDWRKVYFQWYNWEVLNGLFSLPDSDDCIEYEAPLEGEDPNELLDDVREQASDVTGGSSAARDEEEHFGPLAAAAKAKKRKKRLSALIQQYKHLQPRNDLGKGQGPTEVLLRPADDRRKHLHRRSRRISTSLLEEAHEEVYLEQYSLLPHLSHLLPVCLETTAPDGLLHDGGGSGSLLLWARQRQEVLEELVGGGTGQRQAKAGKIRHATLMKLVEKLTTPYSHDLQYMKTFMLTYVYFTKPEILLKLLMRRYYTHPAAAMAEEEAKQWRERVQTPIQLRVFNIIKIWVERYDQDFDRHMLQYLRHFAQHEPSLPPIMSQHIIKVVAKQLGGGHALQRKPKSVSDYQFNAAPPYPDVPKNIFSHSLGIWDIPDVEIARQLTILEFSLLAAIEPREVLKKAWTSGSGSNVQALLAFSASIRDAWLPALLEQAAMPRQQAKVLKRLVIVASELLKLNNFNGLAALVGAIRRAVDRRDFRGWEDVPGKFKRDLRAMESVTKQPDLYRARLPSKDPCIPILDFHLQQIASLEAIVPSTVGHMANFAKCRMVYHCVSELTRYQQTPYNLQPVTQVARLLLKHINYGNQSDATNVPM